MSKGFAIALAWPETCCKQPGSWYDPMLLALRINKAGYYKVGHAALVLIDNNGNCAYYDFGRYHAPHGYGRVRSAYTDSELKMNCRAEIDMATHSLKNMEEIIREVHEQLATHGDGATHASSTVIDHDIAMTCLGQMLSKDKIPYGPFVRKGTNCSRFVRTVIADGSLRLWQKLRLNSSLVLTPTPLSNIRALGRGSKMVYPEPVVRSTIGRLLLQHQSR